MTVDLDEQWIFTPAHLQSTPSRTIDDIPTTQELKLRNDGIHYLLRCGNALKLKSNVLSSAATYFHRFYMRYSIGPSGHDKVYVACACIFLASKVEESTRKLKDVAQVCYMKYANNTDTKNIEKWMDRILTTETIVLEALCFDLVVPHPHEFLAAAFGGGHRDSALWAWRGPLANREMVVQGVYQLAWSVANDSLRTPLCLFYHPRLIASAAWLIAFLTTYTMLRSTPQEATALSIARNEKEAFAPADDVTGDSGHSQPAYGSSPVNGAADNSGLGASGDQMQQEEAVKPPLIFEDLLGGSGVAGPWRQAFRVEDQELKTLPDIVGNILEVYYNAEPPMAGLTEIQRISPPKLYSSLTGSPQPNIPNQSLATTNSSPALTLASNATPMHRYGEDSSQEFPSTQPENSSIGVSGAGGPHQDIAPASTDPDADEQMDVVD